MTYNKETKSVAVKIRDRILPARSFHFTQPSDLLRDLAQSKLCVGNSDLKVTDQSEYAEMCTILIRSGGSERCFQCRKYRKTLQKHIERRDKQAVTASDRTAASSKSKYSHLNRDELLQRARNLSSKLNKTLQDIKRLRKKLDDLIVKHGIEVDHDTSSICQSTISSAADKFESGSLRKLFLEQQLKANSAKSPSGMRWHPSIIRWCLVMHSKSRSAYRYIRQSEAMSLPSERTLSDYICYKPLETGCQTAEILDLQVKYGAQDVSVCFDEMKVKEGLVYCPFSGSLTGYVDSLDSDSILDVTDQSPKLASHALAFQVRGLKSDLSSVIATYATSGLTAELLYSRFWDTVANLELAGFRVRIAVSDGAATNRKFYKLHKDDFPNDKITYRAINKFSPDQRTLYFASDSCHLVKTTRNCMERSRFKSCRHLLVSLMQNVVFPLITLQYMYQIS